MLRLRTLGECLIELGEIRLGPEADVLFTVLLYLSAERDRRLSRSAVAELFWPGLPPRRARHCLRQVLYRLRALGLVVEAEHEYLRLAAAQVEPGFAAAPSREQFDAERRAGTLVLGPFLGGYVPEASPAFAEWIDRYRGHLHFHVRRVLLEVAREHRLRGEWSDVEWLARECLRLDPLNEEATLALAESMAMVGGKAEAIAYLDRYIADLGGDASAARLPATVLRRRIAERFPTRRYAGPADRCFVGRATLLATVATALLRARNGDGGALLLWGAAGIGKSRLAAEAAKVAVMEGVRIVRVQCEESASARPLAVLLESLPELLTCPGAIGCAPASLALLRRLLRVDPAPPTEEEPADVVLSPGSLRRAVLDLVDAVSHEVPLLLLVEDAQWADPASWALLRDLVEWSARQPILLLFTSRTPHPTPTPPARTTTRLERHEVPPLDDAAAMELVRAVAAEAQMQIPDDAAAWCLEAGEGNPLFLQELAGHWVETGQTRGTPPSLQMLLETRLDRLSPTARRVLQAAVVLGGYATPERLSAVLGLATHVVVAALDELAGERVISEREDCVAARHDAVAQLALSGVNNAGLRLLHRRAAIVLEAELAVEPRIDTLFQCYEQWAKGSRSDRGCETITAIVPRLLSHGAAEKALELLDRALRDCTTQPRNDEILRTRVVVASHSGQPYRMRTSLEALVASAPVVLNDASAGDRIDLIDTTWRLGSRGAALVGDLLHLASATELTPRTRTRAIQIGLAICDNENDLATAQSFRAQLSSLTHADSITRRLITQATMIFECGFGDIAQGKAAARDLIPMLNPRTDQASELKMFRNIAEALQICGSSETAPRLLHLYHQARAVHSPHFAVFAADNLFATFLDRGDLPSARVWLARAHEEAKHCADFDSHYGLLSSTARMAIADRDRDRVERAIDAMHDLPSSRMSLRRQRTLVTLKVHWSLVAMERQGLASLIDELESLHNLMQSRSGHDRTAVVLVEALARVGCKQKARSLLNAYLGEYRRGGENVPAYLAVDASDTSY